jgi:hypothetical protein
METSFSLFGLPTRKGSHVVSGLQRLKPGSYYW